ncbi:MAG: DUF885 family protein, partial [Alphaproteobacteria bacterium]|nr:DUF885 family protein [Alphaproteobacteria bacterium]
MRLRFLAAAAIAALAAAGLTPGLSAAQAQPAAAARSPQSVALAKLFADSDEAALKRNPIQGLFRGDMRYAAQFGDYITDAYYAAEKTAAEDELARLNAIDRSKLSADEQVSYDVFKWQRTMDLRGYDPAIMAAQVVRPLDHFTGFHVFMPDISSGQGAAPFRTVADYENNLKRLDGFLTLL